VKYSPLATIIYFQKDCCEGGGGVFIYVCKKTNLKYCHWTKTLSLFGLTGLFAKEDPIYICTYYRPPNNMLQPQKALNQLNSSTSFPNILEILTSLEYSGQTVVVNETKSSRWSGNKLFIFGYN